MSRGWAKASACRLQITLYCAFLCHIGSLQYLSRSSLHRLAGLPCRLFLSYGIQVVTREVHRSSLRRLICPAQDHFICLTVLIISMTCVLSLTQMLVFLSLYVILSIPGLALADRQFVISERISQMTKGNVTAFVNLTKAIKQLINSMFLNVFETNCL